MDSLCQPIEETGNPVQVYPVDGYPLGVRVSWEPTQEGEGDPSPDNIRPITGRDAVKVTRCGKNLVNIPDFTLSVDTNDRTKNILVNVPAGTYTLSLSHTNTSSSFGVQIHTKNGFITSAKFPYTFTVEIDVKTIHFYIKNEEGNLDNISNIQLELGSTATPYEPYTGSTTGIALPETVYGGTLDVETGVVTVDRALITADRSLFKLVSSSRKNYYQCMPGKHPMPYPDQTYLNQNTRCNVARIAEPYIVGLESDYLAYIIHDGRIRLSVALYDSEADIKICYPIKDTYTIQLTSQQIAALSGVNTIYTDADSVVVTGAEDPKHTIAELKNAIISLGGNI